MSPHDQDANDDSCLFTSAEWYDVSIDWDARIRRELPVLVDVLGPPGGGGVVDAGCGTGHQARALAGRGYRVVGTDASDEMLQIARESPETALRQVEFVVASYAELHDKIGGGFDGICCVGNAMAAAGTRDEVARAVAQFGKCLHPGGRLFVQILNFSPMSAEQPCVRGPRTTNVDGREYVSVRHFQFLADHALVTNVTLWYDKCWHQRAHVGRLYPVVLEELQRWCSASQLRIDDVWGSYAREPFEENRSVDLLIAATRV